MDILGYGSINYAFLFYAQFCDPSCLTCSDTTSTSCLIPLTTGATRLTCLSNEYRDATGMCIPCPYGCTTCSSSTACTACEQRKYRVQAPVSGLCPCLPGFYEDATGVCLACPISRFCATCAIVSGSTNTGGIDCLSCACDQHRVLASGNCICDTGFSAANPATDAYCAPV